MFCNTALEHFCIHIRWIKDFLIRCGILLYKVFSGVQEKAHCATNVRGIYPVRILEFGCNLILISLVKLYSTFLLYKLYFKKFFFIKYCRLRPV